MRQTALNTVYDLAKSNSKIIFIGSDLGVGTLNLMKKDLPNQFFMEGISEQHLIGFAAGLAKQGFIPYLNTIANFFSRRALEQIILDVALHKLPVKILASGGGMVYAPLGPTHTATDDLAHILTIPNLNVYAPCDASEMKAIVEDESNNNGPAYIRFGKGGESLVSENFTKSNDGFFKYFGDLSANKAIITTGVVVQGSLDAVRNFAEGEVLLIHVPKLNFRKSVELKSALRNKEKLVVVEEHQQTGGLMTQLLHYSFENSIPVGVFSHLSLGSEFVRNFGSQVDHFEFFGFTSEQITKELMR